ncbi:MlaA family lipoprotein, partial [Methylibium sp.]|uniref:MlaA family lipoprotein n=1 Tax=Methylibium sp. TaxID=2067992 RepID=UPI00179A1B4E
AYIVWPILGPSTVRDSIGLPIDIKASPDQLASRLAASATLTVVRVINTRAGLLRATNLLDDIALDKYTFVRDAFLQRRRSLVYDGDPPEDDYDERPDLPLPAPGAAPLPSGAASEAPVR